MSFTARRNSALSASMSLGRRRYAMRFSMARVIFSVPTTSAVITSRHSTARITQAIEYWGGPMISGGAGSASSLGATPRSSGTGLAELPRAQQGDHVLDLGALPQGEQVAEVQAVQRLRDADAAGLAVRCGLVRTTAR